MYVFRRPYDYAVRSANRNRGLIPTLGGAAVSVELTGTSSVVAEGTIVSLRTTPLTGTSSVTQSGILVGKRFVPLAGNEAASATGSLIAARVGELTGQSSTASAGTLSVIRTALLSTDLSAVGEGTLVALRSAGLLGELQASSAGTLVPGITVEAGLTGEAVTTTTGIVSVSRAVPLSTFLAAISYGELTPVGGEAVATLLGKPGAKTVVLGARAENLITITQSEQAISILPPEEI